MRAEETSLSFFRRSEKQTYFDEPTGQEKESEKQSESGGKIVSDIK